eukprot:gnl/TRDRNA2_/TRDRNA2_131124_c1_seq1.p1 gnl/TRDRNA2_/TRDRNA2_131124_c1~~gnl/TRDRNA2_/TRDRNA2_131124_c1_seq1.p1  ORF type:complete len:463 (-),score=85.03 gnl/TRDRNA2_/TRDRNA2_131124_c1_seq1:181-1569(-)
MGAGGSAKYEVDDEARGKKKAHESRGFTIRVAPASNKVEEIDMPRTPSDPKRILMSADVGGTSSRFYAFEAPHGTVEPRECASIPKDRLIYKMKFKNEKFESFTAVVQAFLKAAGLEQTPPAIACLAVAGVVVDNTCSFVNLGWVIDAEKLQEETGITQIALINDFVAQGYGILTLDIQTECDIMQDAEPLAGAPIAVLGAGTGLGEAFLTTSENDDYEVWPSEGGHAEFAPRQDGSSQLEFEMVQYLQIKYSLKHRISCERVISGRGISNIYHFLAWKYPEKVNRVVHRRFMGPIEGPQTNDPAVIVEAATSGECGLCQQTMDMFVGAFGAEAGVMGLKYMPFGGLYLTGGVTSKTRDFILGNQGRQSHFMESFLDKGRVSGMLTRIPVYLVRGEDLGERGAVLKATRLWQESADLPIRRKSQRGTMSTSGTLQIQRQISPASTLQRQNSPASLPSVAENA